MFGLENNTEHTEIQIQFIIIMVRGCASPLAYRYKNIPIVFCGEFAHMFVNEKLLGASVNPDSVFT